jgi:hypothetical protein
MGDFLNFLGGLFGGGGGGGSSSSSSSNTDILPIILALLGTAAVGKTGVGDAKVPVVGYQGGIPSYKGIQSQIPRPPNPFNGTTGDGTGTTMGIANPEYRRPGSAGRRYFEDLRYVDAVTNGTGTGSGTGSGTGTGIGTGIGTGTGGAGGGGGGRGTGSQTQIFAQGGGIAGLKEGTYLRGGTDGMSDEVPASINGDEPAALSDGEFVVPADVVSHLGNGNSDAGAKRLYAMMDEIRKARTGTEKQGKQIDPAKFMPTGGRANV